MCVYKITLPCVSGKAFFSAIVELVQDMRSDTFEACCILGDNALGGLHRTFLIRDLNQ